MKQKTCWIFDIDGTLADGKHRQHFLKGERKNWPAYQKLAHADAPVLPVVKTLKSLHSTGEKIIIASGRIEDEREVATSWLEKQRIYLGPARDNETRFHPIDLFMRPAKDYREDSIIKEEILNRIRADGYTVLGVFDDRNRVVQMWRRNGVFVFHVDQTSVSEDF